MPRRSAPLLVLLALGVVLGAGPAVAHEADPRIVTTLDGVEPALPDGVVVQVQAGIATQLVARNPTTEVLEVLGERGRAFLRISSAGVLADVGAPEFFTTANPTGSAPTGTREGPERWVQVGAGDSWGWYDHRLHPDRLRAPADEERAARLGGFEVPLRYGGQPVVARGSIAFRPLLGSFQVSADPAPAGLQVQVLPGRLPGLLLTAEPGREVTVLGRDGEPFLRFTEAGVEVNERSRTHAEDRAARGQQADPPSTTAAFELVAPAARSYTWLDTRLRATGDLPPEPVLRAEGPTRVGRWEVPVQVDGRPLLLTGDIRWVPEPDAAARVSGRAADLEQRALLPYALGGAAVLVLAGAVLGLRRRRVAQARG